MRTLFVVDGDGLPHHPPGLRQVPGTVQQELGFQDAVDPLRQGILVAVVAVGHRAADAVLSMQLLVAVGAVLHAPVRVMDQRRRPGSCLQRLLQGLRNLCRMQGLMNVVAHDLARVRIRDQADVAEPGPHRQIGDVRHPDLLGRRRHHLLGPRLEQVGVAPEAVMAVRGLVIGARRRHQQPVCPQQVEQPVPAHAQRRQLLQQMLQLARADPGLTPSHLDHLGQHGLCLRGLGPLALLRLVPRLAAEAEESASPADSQSADGRLGEDLPSCFFTEIP